jgi:hypothetical protein
VKKVIELLELAKETIEDMRPAYADIAIDVRSYISQALAELKTLRREKLAGENLQELEQDKFIVINRRRFEELNAMKGFGPDAYLQSHSAILNLKLALENFQDAYEAETGKPLNQKYIVVNQDEPYAEEVARLVLGKPPHWYTPERWEAETGEAYPEEAPVWSASLFGVSVKPNKYNRIYWSLKKYGDAKNSMNSIIFCAYGHMEPPPNDWRPEDEK